MDDHGQGEDLIIVYRAADQYEASIIEGLLKGAGIPVVLESKQVPWLDGVMKMGEGYWGDVVVPKEFEEESLKLIEEFKS